MRGLRHLRLVAAVLALASVTRAQVVTDRDDPAEGEWAEELDEPARESWVEPPAPAFGARGSFVVTGGSGASITSTSYESSEASHFRTGLSLWCDYFVVENVALGLGAGFSRSQSRGYAVDGSLIQVEGSSVSGGIRAGVNVPLGTLFSLYPRVTFGVESTRSKQVLVTGQSLAGSPLGRASTSYVGPWLRIHAPLLLHPRSHFFVGLDPSFFRGFGRALPEPEAGGERTAFEIDALVGVWWGGATEPKDSRSAEVNQTEHRFGKKGQLVLSNESGLSVGSLTYGGSKSGSRWYTLAPGFDYFIEDHAFVGLSLSFWGAENRAIEPSTTSAVRQRTRGLQIAGTVGGDFPLLAWLSVSPKLVFAFESEDQDIRTDSDRVAYEAFGFGGAVKVPLLFHIAPHAFVGLGPNVWTDLSRHVEFESGSTKNPRLRIGAGTILGGWID